jgi:hypothetical protein
MRVNVCWDISLWIDSKNLRAVRVGDASAPSLNVLLIKKAFCVGDYCLGHSLIAHVNLSHVVEINTRHRQLWNHRYEYHRKHATVEICNSMRRLVSFSGRRRADCWLNLPFMPEVWPLLLGPTPFSLALSCRRTTIRVKSLVRRCSSILIIVATQRRSGFVASAFAFNASRANMYRESHPNLI